MESYQDRCVELTEKLCRVLRIEEPRYTRVTIKDRIREIVVAKLCEIINIECSYNYENSTFYFFSMYVGESLINKLRYNIRITPKGLGFLNCNGKNLSQEVHKMLDTSTLEDSLLNCFNFLDDYKDEVDRLKLNKYCI